MRLSIDVCPIRVGIGVALLSLAVTVQSTAAATRTVCANNCAYSDFQAALDAAQPGDTILLRAGETFVGNFVLPAKAGNGLPIVIRSDAADTVLPGDGIRLIPNGVANGNTSVSTLAKLKGVGGLYWTTPVLAAAAAAHGYRLQFLEIDGTAQEGWADLVELGSNSTAQASLAVVPHDIVLDRIFIHGHPTKGQKRCVSLNGAALEILNSYISNCASFDNDAQAIAGFNGPGPFRIINNYLEASGENVMFGGADPVIAGLVPSDIEIRRNYFSKPLAWRDPVLSRPTAPSVTSIAGGGALGVGTDYFTVVALMDAAGATAVSASSQASAVAVRSDSSAVTLTWSAVSGADRYRVYRGTSSAVQNVYIETSGSGTSLTYTGFNEIPGSPPTSGTLWSVKNLIELKNAQRVLIDGNVIENTWLASQIGYAIVLTPRNQDGGASWVVVRDITVSNNIIRHAAGGINILGEDYGHPSLRTSEITVRNNLVYDIGSSWGGTNFLLMTGSPVDVTLDHNTIFQEGMIVLIDSGASSGFQLTNNVAPHNDYGVFGSGAGFGNNAFAAYFPGAVVRRNALGGGPPSMYPPDNFFPDMATFNRQFVNIAGADFHLVPGGLFANAGTDGKDLGVDFTALTNAMTGAAATPGSGGTSASGAFNGVMTTLPGIVQAEDFDEGGNGVAYQDNSAGNTGGQYRATDVDIEPASDSGGGQNVGWAFAGEWLKYTVNVAAAGVYDVEVRVASAGAGGTFHLDVNGTNVTGALTVPDTGGWQTWTTVRKTGVTLSAGQQQWRLSLDTNGSTGGVGNFNYMRVTSSSPASAAYGGSTPTVPATTIQFENFDEGGAGVGYVDATAGNSGGAYRTTDVDIETTTDIGGGYGIGWAVAGEWLKYTLNVTSGGVYDLDVRVASAGPGGTFHIEANGTNVTGPLTVPNTGSWQTWTTIKKSGLTLAAGPQAWRVVMDTNGSTGAVGNFNYFKLTAGSASSPFGGSTVTLPGIVQAENFDDGGAAVAYVDTSSGNAGGAYRSTDVDIETTTDSGGGYNLGWVTAGEWLNYRVNVSAAGTYDLDVRVASAGQGGTFHLEANGTNITGPLSVPNTGGWQAWTTIRKSGITFSAGSQVWRLVMDTNGATGAVGNFNYIKLTGASPSTPYGGTASVLPGTLQAENFDEGGAGRGYVDTTTGNSGGEYRSTDVDIERTSDGGSGYSLGWVLAGEWLNYTVNVTSAGTYDLDFRVASAGVGGTFHLEVNGVDKTGPISIPTTGGWQTWTTIRKTGVALASGSQVWRLVMDANGPSTGIGNFNFITVSGPR